MSATSLAVLCPIMVPPSNNQGRQPAVVSAQLEDRTMGEEKGMRTEGDSCLGDESNFADDDIGSVSTRFSRTTPTSCNIRVADTDNQSETSSKPRPASFSDASTPRPALSTQNPHLLDDGPPSVVLSDPLFVPYDHGLVLFRSVEEAYGISPSHATTTNGLAPAAEISMGSPESPRATGVKRRRLDGVDNFSPRGSSCSWTLLRSSRIQLPPSKPTLF
ncbi:hypothetical protein FB45DRAFT_565547 [Roridomyces roridus]|uniref:Uncharacterized protein n=1 Tax=Roridomyces roridus TaxID=1738132 RepID=A0AAD7F973_9AGAR|nr:hypothetical protein FB45DRAFT_565547 [Roridomyces roridus]